MGINKLYKTEKLCSKREIEQLYSKGSSIIAYPLRAVWLTVPGDNVGENHVVARFLISIPKKRVRHAVDRVLLRRRTREAYRLNRQILDTAQEPINKKTLLIGFNWVANERRSYATIERSMRELLSKIAATVTCQTSDEGCHTSD